MTPDIPRCQSVSPRISLPCVRPAGHRLEHRSEGGVTWTDEDRAASP
jgi:hypothetical protein